MPQEPRRVIGSQHRCNAIELISKRDWIEYLTLPGAYSAYIRNSISMLKKLESMSDGYLGYIKAGQLKIDLNKLYSPPIHTAQYCTGPEAREIDIQEIDGMLAIDLMDPAQAKWASSVVFVTTKDGTPRFRVDFLQLDAVMILDPYPIPCIGHCVY